MTVSRTFVIVLNLGFIGGAYRIFASDIRGMIHRTQSRRPTLIGMGGGFVCLAAAILVVYELPPTHHRALFTIGMIADAVGAVLVGLSVVVAAPGWLQKRRSGRRGAG